MTTAMILNRLMSLKGFRMEGYLVIHAEGLCYDASQYPIDEGLFEALVFFESQVRARELVKAAKITL